MTYLVEITLIAILAGMAGTGFGGFLTSLLKKPRDVAISVLLAFSAGVMLIVVFNELIPEALEFGGLLIAVLGIGLGIGFMKAADIYLPEASPTPANAEGNDKDTVSPWWRNRYLRTALLLGLGITMHNLPEGLAIGAGYMASESLGLTLALIIGLHNIPEGMAMAAPMKAAHVKSSRIVFWSALAGAPMGLGALLGGIMGGVSPSVLSLCLGFAAGAMAYIVFDQLLPYAKETAEGQSATFGAIAGMFAGMAILILSH